VCSYRIVHFLLGLSYKLQKRTRQTSADSLITSSDGNTTNNCVGSYTCSAGVILPIWYPQDPSFGDKVARAIVYFVAMIYMFLGVSIVADRFMSSIEVITSQEREITIKKPNGETTTTTVRIWNETVSNLTLMALGSSAPEILLSVIEVCGHGFVAGELGPSTIVGSAAFNMFVIIAICVNVVPDGEVRRIKHLRVFFVTATWSIFAYTWLYLILAVMSPGVVEVWESLVTFLFFPVCVLFAWVADRRLLFYKYMYKRYRTGKQRSIIIERGGEAAEGGQAADGVNVVAAAVDEKDRQDEESRREMARILKELKQKHPDKEMEQLIELANYQRLSQQTKSRAFYRIQAIRLMTGAGNILKRHAADQARKAVSTQEVSGCPVDDGPVSKIYFEPAIYQCLENCGSIALTVVRRGGDLTNIVSVDFRTEDGTANEKAAHVSESVGVMEVKVLRMSGARGAVVLPYRTVEGSAHGSGVDFEDTYGELEFQNDEIVKTISIKIVDRGEYEKQASFFIALGEPVWIRRGHPLTNKEEEEKRIADMGRPVLGEHTKLEIIIEESYEFKNTVDKLIKKTNLALVVGTNSWREQFIEAITVSSGEDDEDDECAEEKLPSCFDYVMHFLTVFWKVFFAFVPPTDYWNGWACFVVSILMIGFLTAFIGDLASHFGCTIGLKDSVTAVVFVALGTSVPDTFASKVAAIQDQYADASIGNVTGSNAVNIFLGIGVAWTVAAVYWSAQGKDFEVQPGTLAFSVTLYTIFAFISCGVLLYRRRPEIGGELGGPRTAKRLTSSLFVLLWLLYILFSSLEAYCYIKGF
uniref:Solute carrier family 8 member 1b n=1 Tax=Callorhinchus milii TaxID=7868 RepID=A0A4W3JSN4_CALMI